MRAPGLSQCACNNAYLDPDIGMRESEYAGHRREIEKGIAERQRAAADLRARIETKTITQEQMQAVEESAADVRKGIDLLGFEEKRRVLELLRVQGRVCYDDDEEYWIELEGLFPLTGAGLSPTSSEHGGPLFPCLFYSASVLPIQGGQ
jgi:hypothetical protein